MSSGEDSTAQIASKKRRLQGACDICRRKKIRCDSAEKPGNRCSGCIAFNLECTHDEPIQKRGPKSRYTEQLESRVQSLEETIRTIKSDKVSSPASTSTSGSPSNFIPDSSPSLGPSSSKSTPSSSHLSDAQDEDDFAHITLSKTLERLDINALPCTNEMFFGPSSGFMLMQSAIGVKHERTGDMGKKDYKRLSFWTTHSWERAAEAQEIPQYQFPEEHLRDALVTTFFSHINLSMYLLHEPTFRRDISEGLHLRHPRFSALLLMVCAVAARHSNDPRVYLEGSDSTLSSGWKWFDQVQILPKYMFDTPRTYELQIYCLAALFYLATSLPQGSRTMTGLGLRLSQELGVHRRKPDGYRPTFQDELQKRAFWFLLSIDILSSAFTGRPSAVREEDYDAELPVDCDDEYWDIGPDSTSTFRQPPGKPSRIAGFNCMIQLGEILARAMRNLYAIQKTKNLLGLVGDEVDQRLVAELDSALNKWVDSVPSYLRWDPKMENLAFFNQSAILYSLYYTVQIQIHRPFIHKPSPLTFSSLAVCANAARSCSHVLDAHLRRGVITLPQTTISAFIAGLVLLMNVWRKQPGFSLNLAKELADVEKCMNVLHATEDQLTTSGRLWDMLQELASHHEVIIPQCDENASSKKRQHNPGMTDTVPLVSMNAKELAFDFVPPEISSMANPNPSFDISSESWNLLNEVLPMYSNELSRLPIYAGGLPSTSLPSTSNHAQHPHVTADALQMGNVTGTPSDGLPTLDTLSSFDAFNSRQVDYNALTSADNTLQAFPDTLDIWSSAPAGFSFEEWGQYIGSFGDHDLFPSSAQAT